MKRKRVHKMIIGLTVLIVLLLLFVVIVFPPSKGEIPCFYDDNGKILENSVTEKCYLDVDGDELGMIIMAKNINNPVLLVCGGGPGIPEYLLEDMYPSKLADKFVVCYLEYRGTGLSYNSGIKAEEMTTERYVSDVIAVTDYLSERFEKEKIYIMGHSFGSYIALKTIQLYPDYYCSYIAMAQVCNQRESEYRAYDYMKAQYEQAGNRKMVEKFNNCPIRESDEMYEKYFSSSLRDTAMHGLGVGTTRDMESVIKGIFFPSLRCKAYTWQERINIWKGKAFSMQFPVVQDSINFNAFNEVSNVQIPIYFIAGKYDYTCCYDLQYEYYEYINAPEKEFYTFENSAHSPIFEEPDTSLVIIDKILQDDTKP
ncbi:MAG: alpha/beta hydrolase [Acutalibacteraceae bacterium]|nr:alpha/beta hydrolase [Acutalibacteraceae bacterium]MEE1153539.1 alpha/beta hydrolase [Acutalibacteraceae bacterium]